METKMAGKIRLLSAVVALQMLCACTYPIRNLPATVATSDQSYTWRSLPPDDMPGTLVIVTASGGGTRAATLATAVFRALDKIELAPGKSVADEIDILSSVSGGSVASAYFALRGTKGLDDFEARFLRQDGMKVIAWNGLNPVGLAKLSTPAYERIDLLINYLDDTLFRGLTFADLKAASRRPYLILNAADMVEGVPFPFTQYQLDTICSDLSKIKLSTAVAASAAFPGALSPVTLRNYSPCGATPRPGWIDEALKADWQVNPERMAYGRTADAYAAGRKEYIPLLDGGIADNLGISEPFRLLTNTDVSPLLWNQIQTGKIEKILFVMINARSFKPSALDHQEETPGLLDMLQASIDSSIDRATFNSAERLRDLLTERFKHEAEEVKESGDLEGADRIRKVASNTNYIAVDFDAIPDALRDCRRRFHSIPTNWNLNNRQNSAILAMGEALVNDNPHFAQALASLHGNLKQPMTHIIDACGLLTDADNAP
jgi:predicted acylesterase/phospholipase RssA